MKKFVALVLACTLSACAGVQLKPAYTVLSCRAKVLAPYVGDVAELLVAQTESIQAADAGRLLLSLGVPLLELQDVVKAYRACGAPTELPAMVVPSQEPEVVLQ